MATDIRLDGVDEQALLAIQKFNHEKWPVHVIRRLIRKEAQRHNLWPQPAATNGHQEMTTGQEATVNG
jgi:hypothetical protein